jgi:hypothetical protein
VVTRSPSSSPNLLLRLSGAQLDVLERTPADRAKFYGVGVSILTSACIAAVSMAYAVHLAFQANPVFILLAAVAWGIAVLRLNYWMVASLPRLKSLRSLLLMAIPRVLMSVLLAAIISVPFVLQIFSAEIRAEIPVVQHEQLNAFLVQQRNSPLEQKIAADQATISQQQAIIAAGGVINPFQNQSVVELNAELQDLEKKSQADYNQLACEIYGGPGCIAGSGQALQAARLTYASDTVQTTLVNQQLTKEIARVRAANEASKGKIVAAAVEKLGAAQEALKADQNTQATALANFNRTNGGTGLLIQLKALSALSSGDSTLEAAQYLLFFLFVLIDCLPVTTRVLIQLGPETSYDKVLAMEDSMTLRVNEDVVTQRAARLLLDAEQTIEEASAKFAAEAAERLREHPEEIADGPTSLYRSLLSDEPVPGKSRRATRSASRPRSGRRERAVAVPSALAAFTEHPVAHAEGQLWRLALSDGEFLLVDSIDGIPTLNWTAVIGVREFALLVSERIELGERGEPSGTLLISMAGAADEVDARLGVQLASLATSSLDQRCDFIRFDDHQVGMALQSLSDTGNDSEQVRLFGISSAALSMDSVVSLISRTATSGIRAHALEAGRSPLIARLGTLTEQQASRDAAARREL